MALYMFQAAYTAEAVAAQIKEPRDRIEAVRASAEAVGARIIAGGYSFGEYDVVILAEAPDDVTAASISLATVAGGAVRLARTTRLLSGQEWVEPCRRRKVLNTGRRVALADSRRLIASYRPAATGKCLPSGTAAWASPRCLATRATRSD